MNILPSVLFALVSLLLPLANVFALTDQEPPLAVIATDDFQPMSQAWQPVSGDWAVADRNYAVAFNAATSISTITQYRDIDPAAPPDSQLRQQDYIVRARVQVTGSNDTEQLGVVYGYQDPANYFEATISGTGGLRVFTVVNGVAHNAGPGIGATGCVGAIPRKWCEIEIHWNHGVTTVKVNGQQFFQQPFAQNEFTLGQVGLVTHNCVGRFDKVFIGVPYGDQGFFENFQHAPFVTFTPQAGQWSVVSGTYRSGVQQTSITLAPIRTGINIPRTFEYTFRARLFNGYANPGNLVGIVFNYEGSNSYTEAVFSPTGVAKLNRFENGVTRTLATASYDGRQNFAFKVTLENSPTGMAVVADGVRIFENVDGANPQQFPQGGVGLITHWAPGRFDDVRFDHGVFQPCSIPFDAPPQPSWIVSGTWNTNGGTLNDASAGQTDLVDLHCFGNSVGDDAGANFSYKAQLFNGFANSGNLVGLTFNYQDSNSFYAGDYFELVFSPTGVVQLNKIIQGTRYPVRTSSYTVPRATWFDVEVIRSGILTSVRVNGEFRIANVPLGDLRGGSVGMVGHFAKGHYDEVSLTDFDELPSQ
jgi:hypothetical protein